MKRTPFLFGGFLLAPLLLAAHPVRPVPDGCALLTPADLTVLLGGKPTARPSGGGCSWTVAGSARKLVAIPMQGTGPSAQRVYDGARLTAIKGAKRTVVDEAGLGDKAFSSLEAFGVLLVSLKQGRVLQLQYWTGAKGLPQDVAALRPVAMKAIGAF